MAPKIVPAMTPNTNPHATRQSVASACCCSSPVAARSLNVFQITDGGGTRRPLDKPMRTAISQNSASATGSKKPSAGRRRRAAPAFGVASGTPACSTPAVINTRDTAEPSNAISRVPTRATCARGRRTLLRGRHVAIVDELVDGLLDVDAGADHTRLLQRTTRFEDRFPLRRADLVVGELGAFLELLVDDRAIQAGDADEYLLQLIVIGERIFARLLVSRNHPPHHVGVILGELLAHVEDAPRIGFVLAVKQPGAVLQLVLRPTRIAACPGVYIDSNM